ncbi:flagella basal body P-ring formation protein FlgA [Desulfobaculum xiamenense]|uniref:Flagella basal body P-ring formation protein FlgA n=1 Tax=Desulfobaculum xiamenense TaxID=995050 RepID=A0A846QP43_9BACT|nr:flagellar basal body P-ring formation chaperone FlgA [Desulfobaculum xiamenense]NJB66984.1 flagella basal body P-ring formation protein FlgA [Desulfobaculum xiamenense]
MRTIRNTMGMRKLTGFAPALAVLTALAVMLVCLMAAIAQAGEVKASWRIAVRPAAVVEGDVVRLGDIASVVGKLSAPHWQTLAATELWRAPATPGEQTSIPREKLNELLAYYLEDLAQLCIVPGRLVVQRGGSLVQRDRIVSMIVETLTPQMRNMPGENSLRDFRLPEYVFLGDSQNYLECEVSGEFAPGRLSLLIREVGPEGGVRRKFTGTAFLDSWRTVACAQRPLNMRETLTPDAVSFERKNVAYLRGEVWDGRTFGMRVMRTVGAGQVIYADILDDVPLISRGDKVSLVYEGQHIQLAVLARAMEDGRFGESIVVRNLQSNRDVSGTVRDGSTVVVR